MIREPRSEAMFGMWSACRQLLTVSLLSPNNTVANEIAGTVEGTGKALKLGPRQ